jgi:hypothetical protein
VFSELRFPLQHFGGWVPIRPFLFAVNGGRTRPPKSLPTDADPVTDRLSAALYQVEKVTTRIDDDCARLFCRLDCRLTYQCRLRHASDFPFLSRDPDAANAQTYFDRALAVARQQQAKSWELRAATSMARLWRDQGKRMETRDLLAPVYGWFTEGFDTRDLKEAKALLDELNA